MRSPQPPTPKRRKGSHSKNSKRLVKAINIDRLRQNQQYLDSRHPIRNDLYNWLLSRSWRTFLLLVFLFYLTLNCLFALLFLAGGDGLANAEPGSFVDAFFFSVQTLSTVGYGAMYPQTLYAQIIDTVEIFTGLILLTILTGLMFARFSRPTAKVIFSRVAVICPYNGIPTLMFRAANQRENQILEAQVHVSIVRNEISSEGHQLRRFYDLELLRSRTPVFGLSWLIMHPIIETSPLYGMTDDTLEKTETQVWVTLIGLDETTSQTIHSRYIYTVEDILPDRHFVDIFVQHADGNRYIDLNQFHEVHPL